MARYRKIEVRTWSDEKFRALSPVQPSGQGLWFFLLTGPHTGPIPGLFRAGRAAMAEELGWSPETFDEAFREVSEQGMAKADFVARLMWLPNAIKHNKPESPNVVKSWAPEFDLLPECPLKLEALEAIKAFVCALGPGFSGAFIGAFESHGESSGKASGKPSWKPSGKTIRNQEQEQEQEQESLGDEPHNDCARRKQSKGSRLPADWILPKPWGEWAVAEVPSWTPDQIRKVAEKFRDYWIAKPGREAIKADWLATWRNWVRREAERISTPPARSLPTGAPDPFRGAL